MLLVYFIVIYFKTPYWYGLMKVLHVQIKQINKGEMFNIKMWNYVNPNEIFENHTVWIQVDTDLYTVFVFSLSPPCFFLTCIYKQVDLRPLEQNEIKFWSIVFLDP